MMIMLMKLMEISGNVVDAAAVEKTAEFRVVENNELKMVVKDHSDINRDVSIDTKLDVNSLVDSIAAANINRLVT